MLLTIDTLRADRIGAYGHPLDTSPNIDRLARRGVRFTDTTAQWPKTWPSLASFFTGRYPHRAGIGAAPRVLPSSLLMLGEIFREAGYDTAAVVANFNAGSGLGFDQGFDHFVESWQEKWEEEAGTAKFENAPGRVKDYTNAGLVTDQALRWLWARDDDDRPFFLWVHYMDPHGPYVPPDEFGGMFRDHYESSTVPIAQLPSYQRQDIGGRLITDLAFYQAQYDREIRYLDREIGRLIETAGWADSAELLIALTADHGESMGEHDYFLAHGKLPYQPTARVPLIVVQPAEIPGGRTIEHPVGLLDMSATIVELAGLPIPSTFEGTSLASTLRGETTAALPEYVFMQSGAVPDAPQLTVRQGRWKLIRVASKPERRLMTGAEYELYDLDRDPGEAVNLAARYPAVVDRLKRELERWYAERSEDASVGEALDIEHLDPGSRKMLEALGYLEPTSSGVSRPR